MSPKYDTSWSKPTGTLLGGETRPGARRSTGLQMPGVLYCRMAKLYTGWGRVPESKHVTEGYPHHTDSCVYCQQPLSAMAIELINKYRDLYQ